MPTSPTERHALFASHQKLAHKFARNNELRLKRVYEYADLFSIFQQAIWEATESYAGELGASFTTYAFTACLNAESNIRRTWRSARRAGSLQTVSLDETYEDSEQAVWQPESKTPPPEAVIAQRELTRLLAEQVRRLDARSRRVILARFEGDQTLEEIAAWEGVSREYIRQLEQKALCKIRQALRMGFPELGRGPKTASKAQVEPYGDQRLRKVARRRALT